MKSRLVVANITVTLLTTLIISYIIITELYTMSHSNVIFQPVSPQKYVISAEIFDIFVFFTADNFSPKTTKYSNVSLHSIFI